MTTAWVPCAVPDRSTLGRNWAAVQSAGRPAADEAVPLVEGLDELDADGVGTGELPPPAAGVWDWWPCSTRMGTVTAASTAAAAATGASHRRGAVPSVPSGMPARARTAPGSG
jgi:hypothetical protein